MVTKDDAENTIALEAQRPDMQTQSAVCINKLLINSTGVTCQFGPSEWVSEAEWLLVFTNLGAFGQSIIGWGTEGWRV